MNNEFLTIMPLASSGGLGEAGLSLFWWIFIVLYIIAILYTLLQNVVKYIKWTHSENKDEVPIGKEIVWSIIWLVVILILIPLILFILSATIGWIQEDLMPS